MDQNIHLTPLNQAIDAKDVISLINDAIKSGKVNDDHFVSRLLSINQCSLGIKYSDQPFNVHNKFTEKFIKQMFGLDQNVDNLLAEGIKELHSKILHVFVESAKDLNISCNPYLKIYFRSIGKNDEIIPISKPLISTHEISTTNPKWKIKLDLLVPDSYENEGLYSKVYKQEICLEVWDKKLKISSFKQFMKWICCAEVDQYIGSAYVKVGKRSANGKFFTYSIPSTPLNLVLPLSEDSIGHIVLKIVWGRLTNHSQNNMKLISYHIMLYTICFEWHINQLQLEENRQLFNDLSDKEDLTYISFLYMPAISLINQHKIQSNITSYEDSVLRRSVLAHLIIQFSTQNKDFTFILAKVLANEQIIAESNTSWLSDHYIKALNEVEKDFVIKINQNYMNKMGSLVTTEVVQKSKSIIELLYILRLLRKYHKKYRALKLKQTINNKIGTEIIEWLKDNVSHSESWPQIIALMAVLSEMFREYWFDCIHKIVGPKGLKLITNQFQSKLKLFITEWADNKNRIMSDNILNYFFFIKELNDNFCGEKVAQSLSREETESIETIEKPKNETVIHENMKPDEDFLKQIPLTEVKSKSSQLSFKDLKFSQLIKGRTTIINELGVDFGDEIYKNWMNERIEDCRQLANNLVRNSLENINENSIYLRGKISSEFFFNVLSQLFYFPLTLNDWWNYNIFESNLSQLCSLCFQICDGLCSYCRKKLNNSSIKEEQVILLLSLSLNTLFVMQKTHFKTDLIEILTDIKANHIWKVLKSEGKQYKNVETNDGFHKASKVFNCCLFITQIADEIQDLEYELTNMLSEYIVQQIYRDISELIETFPNRQVEANYQRINESLKKKLESIYYNVSSKQSLHNLIISIKVNGENVFSAQIDNIFHLFHQIVEFEDENKLIRIFSELAKMYQKFYDQIMSFACLINLRNERVFENYIETEKFTSMTEKIRKNLREK